MLGNDTTVVQARDRTLFEDLAVMEIADSEQVRFAARFGSVSRANARLLKLTRGGYLEKRFAGTIAGGRRAFYSLAPAGAVAAHVPFRRTRFLRRGPVERTLFLNHQLCLNWVYLAAKYGELPNSGIRLLRWVKPTKQLAETLRVMPDGIAEFEVQSGRLSVFVEVDLGSEPLRIWREKIKRYVSLATSGDFKTVVSTNQFRVLVVAASERRAGSIAAFIATITNRMFWISTVESVKRHGLWAPIWLRPGSSQTVALT